MRCCSYCCNTLLLCRRLRNFRCVPATMFRCQIVNAFLSGCFSILSRMRSKPYRWDFLDVGLSSQASTECAPLSACCGCSGLIILVCLSERFFGHDYTPLVKTRTAHAFENVRIRAQTVQRGVTFQKRRSRRQSRMHAFTSASRRTVGYNLSNLTKTNLMDKRKSHRLALLHSVIGKAVR